MHQIIINNNYHIHVGLCFLIHIGPSLLVSNLKYKTNKQKKNICFSAVPPQQECWSAGVLTDCKPHTVTKVSCFINSLQCMLQLFSFLRGLCKVFHLLSSCRYLPFSHMHAPTDRQVLSTSVYARSCSFFTLQMWFEL